MSANAYQLVEQGLLIDAARAIDHTANAPRDLLVLRALLESHVGDALKAKAAAGQLLRESLTPRESTMCWETIGRVELSRGNTADGLRAMGKAFHAAAAARDARLEARLLASHAERLLHNVGLEAATLEMPKLRRAAMHAADPFSLIEFHTLNAEISGKQGLLDAAATAVDTARALLEKFPNIAQRGRLALVASSLAAWQSDYDGSLLSATEALECASRSGVLRVRLAALNNLVFLKLARNEFAEARRYLDEVLAQLDERNPLEPAYRDTELMLALAADDLAAASRVATHIEQLAATRPAGDAYYALASLPNRIRWLYRIGRIEDGIREALDAVTRFERQHDLDHAVGSRLRLLAADGLSRTGKLEHATTLLIEAMQTTNPSVDMIAERLRVTGRLAAAAGDADADLHLREADRILGGVGNLAAQSDVRRDIAETIGEARSAEDAAAAWFTRLAGRITTFLELGGHPPALAGEAFAIVSQANIAYRCTLTSTGADGDSSVVSAFTAADCPSPLDRDHDIRIDFGTHRKQRLDLVCVPRPGTGNRLALFQLQRLAGVALSLEQSRRRDREHAASWSEPTPEQQMGLIASSERMVELLATIRRVATSNVTVLLTGETGVGKELFARALHHASTRAEQVFLPFNCGTVPRDLFDSQLFGHRRGSFTGAHADAPGVIRSAAAGTLFLDEIGEMAIETQPKLLRFLESGEILPLGDTKPQRIDVRIVAATNANLDQMVADGRFREDLYYRLNVIRIDIPPLRERREEIPALVEHFLERFGNELQKPLLRVADETLEYLVLYRWPGNVRQLANELRRLVALAEPTSVLMPAHLSDDIIASRKTVPAGHAPRGFSEVLTRIDQPLSAAVEHIERAAIQRALSVTDGNLEQAAKILGLSRKGLYLKRQRLNLG